MLNYRIDKRHHIMPSGISVMQYGRPAAAAEDNWWEEGGATGCVAAYQPKGAASLAASYTNLANPGTYDAAPGTAPSWSSGNGWEFDSASSQYLTTGVNPTISYSMLIRFSNRSTTGYICGRRSGSGSNEFGILPMGGSSERFCRLGNKIAYVASGGITSGVYGFSGNTELMAYLDGSADVAFSGTPAALWGTYPVPIAALSTNGTISGYQTVYVQAFAIWDNALDSTAMVAVSDAMAAL
jgi:hypothetical protein